jgi:hypothetical protein
MEKKIIRKRTTRKAGDVKKLEAKLFLPDPSVLQMEYEMRLNTDGSSYKSIQLMRVASQRVASPTGRVTAREPRLGAMQRLRRAAALRPAPDVSNRLWS